jgi:hypothetical protein
VLTNEVLIDNGASLTIGYSENTNNNGLMMQNNNNYNNWIELWPQYSNTATCVLTMATMRETATEQKITNI